MNPQAKPRMFEHFTDDDPGKTRRHLVLVVNHLQREVQLLIAQCESIDPDNYRVEVGLIYEPFERAYSSPFPSRNVYCSVYMTPLGIEFEVTYRSNYGDKPYAKLIEANHTGFCDLEQVTLHGIAQILVMLTDYKRSHRSH